MECYDEEGNKVWLFPDKNTSAVLHPKNSEETYSLYFDTIDIENDTLYGYVSRLMRGLRKFSLGNIDKIVIHAEFPNVSPVK